jgi:hypothetical protein
MGHPVITSPKDCMNPKKIEAFAKQNHLPIRQCAGDHKMVEGYNPQTHERDCMTYCDREMGFGLACKIFKFFKTLGLLCLVFGIGIIILVNFA